MTTKVGLSRCRLLAYSLKPPGPSPATLPCHLSPTVIPHHMSREWIIQNGVQPHPAAFYPCRCSQSTYQDAGQATPDRHQWAWFGKQFISIHSPGNTRWTGSWPSGSAVQGPCLPVCQLHKLPPPYQRTCTKPVPSFTHHVWHTDPLDRCVDLS